MKWEVRTMRSGTSFFNPTLFRKALTRCWPVWAISLVTWLLALPVRGLMALRKDLELGSGSGNLETFAERLSNSTAEASVLFALALGVIAAMAMYSYLYSTRSANFMGALPVRREGVFFSHYLAGLVMLLAPNVLVFLLTAAVEAAGGSLLWQPLLVWLGGLCGAEFFFYSFAVFLGMFTGHILALPVFYGIFNALAAAVYYLLIWVMGIFYYGYAARPGAERAVEWLTPVWRLCERVSYASYEPGSFPFYGVDLRAAAVYAGAAVVLTALSALLCRRRQLERAGDVVAVAAMRPVFKYGVALCSGLFFGFLTSQLLGTGSTGLMIAIVLWGAAGYFVAQMLLDKTFRVLRRFPGALAVTAVFAALFLVVGLDLTGYETRVPAPAEVEKVRISGLNLDGNYDSASYLDLTLTRTDEIRLVTDLHRAVADHRDKEGDAYARRYSTLNLTYTLRDGSVLIREYYVGVNPDAAAESGSVAYAAQRLRADRDIAWQAYGFDRAELLEEIGGRLLQAEWDDKESGEYRSVYGDEAQALLAAVKEDFAAGAIGNHSLEKEESAGMRVCFVWSGLGGAGESLEIVVENGSTNTLACLAVLTAD